MNITKTIQTSVLVLFGLLVSSLFATVYAHSVSENEYATCTGYSVRGDYHGGSHRRRVVWNADIRVNGVTTNYQGDWRGVSQGFNLFSRSGGPSNVKTDGYIKLYDCDSYWYHSNGQWQCKWNDWEHIETEHYGIDFNLNSCQAEPTCTPEPTLPPNATPSPTPTPAPVVTPAPAPQVSSGEEKQSAMVLTDPTCTNNNMDASITLYKNGQPVQGVNVKFVYENEAKYAKTEANGRAGVLYGYKNLTDVVIEPEDGYPAQRQKPTEVKNCPVVANPQILGMADTGVVEDTLANLAGVFGTLSTFVGSVLYAKKSKKSKNKKK